MQALTGNSLRRRLKRRILNRRHEFFAICSPGFEHVLSAEVAKLPAIDAVWQTTGGIGFSGPFDTVYLANLQLNTAHRLLLRIKEFSAHTFSMLYNQLKRVEWELWIPDEGSYTFRIASKSSKLNMQQRIIDTCKAAAEQRLSAIGLKARYDANSSLEFTLRLNQNRATLSLDTSGEHLHKRGYKSYTVPAPIRETIAASILLHSQYRDYNLIVDPFCGSDTFLIEGARMASGRPPGEARSFGFSGAPFFNARKLARLRREARRIPESLPNFAGFDVSPKTVRAAKLNLEQAQLEHIVSVQQMNFLDVDFTALGDSADRKLLVSNPPYGKRMGLIGFTETHLAELLVERLSGWTIVIISTNNLANEKELSPITLQTIKDGHVLRFSNGGLRTYLHSFQVN